MKNCIAKRKLLYSEKGSEIRHEFIIYIGMPYPVEDGMVDFPVGSGVTGCHIEVEGLSASCSEVYGMDSVQALNLATNLEPFLRRLQKKYNLYWETGEVYFDD